MKFKVGDKIVPKNGEWNCYLADVLEADYAVITLGDNVYRYDLYKDGKKVEWCWNCQNDANSKLMEKTMDNLEVGDVVVCGVFERKVLATLPGVVLLTYSINHDMAQSWYTVKELENDGYTLKSDEQETTELTLAEVAKLANVPVERLRIKDE